MNFTECGYNYAASNTVTNPSSILNQLSIDAASNTETDTMIRLPWILTFACGHDAAGT